MPEKIILDQERGIIEVHSYGKVTKEEIVDSIIKNKENIEKMGIRKILVDTTLQESMPSTFNIFDIFSKLPSNFCVAVLLSETQKTRQELFFAETVAKNHGIQIQLFFDKVGAQEWLSSI